MRWIDQGHLLMNETMLDLERSLGYVGFIHHFKNYVLRPGEDHYLARAEEEYRDTLKLIGTLETLIGEYHLSVSVDPLRTTIEQYGDKLAVAERMRKAGAGIRDIDAAVRVPDDKAETNLDQLEALVKVQLERARAEASRQRMLMFSAALLFAGLSVWQTLGALRQSQRSQRLLASVMSHIDLKVCITDEADRIVFFNRAFGKVYADIGWTVALGQNVGDLGMQIMPLLSDPGVVGRTLTDTSSTTIEMDLPYKDGSIEHISVFRLPEGGRLFLRRDVTEERLAELRQAEERAQMIARLRASNEELDNFANIASHDLQEPLRGIAINAGFLMREELSETARKRLARMVEMCRREQDMIDALLRFAQLNRVDTAQQVEDPTDHVEHVLENLAEMISDRNGVVTVETPLPPVLAAPGKLRSLFQNLVENALKYNDSAQPHVGIGFLKRATVNGAEVTNVFYVRDNGIGIGAQDAERIWTIFTRGSGAVSDRKGTGAGLAFVKRIVEGYGGRIVFESAEGQGTRFYFTLPLAERETSQHLVTITEGAEP